MPQENRPEATIRKTEYQIQKRKRERQVEAKAERKAPTKERPGIPPAFRDLVTSAFIETAPFLTTGIRCLSLRSEMLASENIVGEEGVSRSLSEAFNPGEQSIPPPLSVPGMRFALGLLQ